MNREKNSQGKNRGPEPIEDLQQLKKGDRVLYNERATPLEVEEVLEDAVMIKGPHGGEYELYDEEEAKHMLVAKPGSRRYSSYAKNLRKVWECKKTGEKTWKHRDNNAKIALKKNSAGFWNLEIEEFHEDIDLPKYGFSDLENAREEAEKIIDKNPEGWL